MSLTSSTSGVSADFKPAPIADADLAYLLRLLFEPAPEADQPIPPTCGFDAACERVIRHLDWFEAEARSRKAVA